jgi:hypothetical protein
MSFSCREDRGDAEDDCFSLFLPGFRESACGPPALWLGAPLKAAAGQATVVKLQPGLEFQCQDVATTLEYGRVNDVKASRFPSATCEPRPIR